jgi:putative flavoprotein involved in K+ transport
MDEKVNTVVIGGGQAGLAAGYYLSQKGDGRGGRFMILDENMRTGDSWRSRWDGLRLFTPAKYNGLPGKPFPAADFYFPTKDETAAYLEDYARSFNLPVQHNVKVMRLFKDETGYQVSTSAGSLHAKNVIVATGAYQKPYTPAFAGALDPAIFQVHSAAYCSPQQVPAQNVLVVGAGNSGAEIGLELARAGKQVWLAGRDVGRIPADRLGRILGGRPYWFLISRVMSVSTPVGRKMRDTILHHGAPLIGSNRQKVADAGIESASRVQAVVSGQPQLEDGRSLPVDGVIWATGFRPDYSWIGMPIFDESGYPRHQRGVVPEAPGLYFTGLPFQTALSSALIGGAGPDAEYVVRHIS